MVGVLTLAYTVSFVDRTIISLLVEPIKSDLRLSDTQLALVQGLAFGVFYAVMGLPFGWLVDRAPRKWIVAVGATTWCLATAACGLATSFTTLCLARIGVGAGEASLSPAAVSMIGDSFPPARASLPLGVYVGASSVGAGLALICGGGVITAVAQTPYVDLPAVGRVRSWQAAFLVVGIAGLVLVPLIALVAEPKRRTSAEPGHFVAKPNILHHFRAWPRFYFCQYAAIALFAAMASGLLAWIPAFFMRRFGWTAGEVGLRYGLTLLLAGGAFTVLGGWLAAHARRRGLSTANIDVALPAILLVAPLMVAGLLAPSADLSLAVLSIALAVYALPGSLGIAAIQEATPPCLQGQAASVCYMVIGVVSLSIGPLGAALLTDYVFSEPSDVGYSLAVMAAVFAPASAFSMWLGRREFKRAIAMSRSSGDIQHPACGQ